MFELYDLVRYKRDGRLYFIIDEDDDDGTQPVLYTLELEDQYGENCIKFAEADEIEFVSKTGSHIKD
jgi:hypothetical protein